MDVSIITVNYRSKDHTERMIASVRKYLPHDVFEILVVNNDPAENLSHLAAEDVQVITPERNLGFAGGCNLALAIARGRYCALINPDIIFVDDSTMRLVAHLDTDRDVGIAGVCLINPDGTWQSSVRRFPTPWDQLLVLSKLPHLIPHLPAVDRYLHHGFNEGKTQDVDQVMGAYFVIRRELLEAIGPLDEGFFFWYEEVDYCRRARNVGWKVRYYADATAVHAGGGSFSRVSTLKKQHVIRRSARRYIRKHFGWRAWILFVLLDPALEVLSILAHLFKRK